MSELSRIYDLSSPTVYLYAQKITATPQECKALAQRFHILDVLAVNAEFKILQNQEEGCFDITGSVSGDVVQASVISLEPVHESVNTPLHIKIRISTEGEREEDFDDDPNDIEFVKDFNVDIGELVAQYLALSLNPYPRKESEPQKVEPPVSKEEHPFAVLSSLKKS